MENEDVRQEKEEMSWDVGRQGIKEWKRQKKNPANLLQEISRTN